MAKELKTKTLEEIKETIIRHLRCIFDPEIPVNIYDLGFIYDIKLEVIKNYMYCTITMTLTSPGCFAADLILGEVYFYTKSIPEIDEVDINLVFDPQWDISHINNEGKEILELNGTVLPQF